MSGIHLAVQNAHARDPRYGAQVAQSIRSSTCDFCPGGRAIAQENLLYLDEKVWGCYNAFPLPNIGIRQVGKEVRQEQYVLSPREHIADFTRLTLDHAASMVKGIQSLFPDADPEVLAWKQAYTTVNGTTIPGHCHLQLYGAGMPGLFQLWYGLYRGYNEARAIKAFYADVLRKKTVAACFGPWQVIPHQRIEEGMDGHFVIKAKAGLNRLRTIDGPTFKLLLDAVAWGERNYDNVQGGVLLHESRYPSSLVFHYFTVRPGQCVHYAHRAARQ